MIKKRINNIINKILDLEITKKIIKIIELNNKYRLLVISSSIAFYFLLSVSSILLLFILFNKYFGNSFDFIITDIFSILDNTLNGLISEINIRLSDNKTSSIILIITSVVSASSIISDLNYFCDQLYSENIGNNEKDKVKRKKYFKRRIEAFIILILLLGIIIFEIGILLFGKYIIVKIFNNLLISKILFRIIEFLMLYLILTLLYIYLPPIPIGIKKVKKISFFVSLIIYFLLFSFRFIINIITYYDIFNSLSYNILIICYLILVIIYIFVYGLVKIFQNKI